MPGTLFVVATPIGNLDDITLRAIRVLKEVDLIACEDTRHTRKLLSHYGISKPMVSYHEHNERARGGELVKKLEDGASIALVSDAGTPLVSDPGYRLVADAIAHGLTVVPIPGASASIAALSVSGLASDSFTFAGFLPSRKSARRARLAELSKLDSTLILYEAPHRARETLADMLEVLGDRPCVVAREMTKLHEAFLRGRLSEISFPDGAARGELVLIIGRGDVQPRTLGEQSNSITDEIARIMKEEGVDQKTALKRVARGRGMGKSEAYRLLLEERASKPLR